MANTTTTKVTGDTFRTRTETDNETEDTMTYAEYDKALRGIEEAKSKLIEHHKTTVPTALQGYYLLLCGVDENNPHDADCSAGRTRVSGSEGAVNRALDALYATTLSALNARADRIVAAGWSM